MRSHIQAFRGGFPMQMLAGIVFIIGSALFIIAAFMPLTIRVIMATDAEKRMAFIANEPTGWLLTNLLFGAGSIVVVIGLALFTLQIQGVSVPTSAKLGGYAATAAAGVAALLWVYIVYNRVALPPQTIASNLGINPWMFPAYTVLTQLALMIVGFVLLQSGYPAWMGWGMLALAALSLVAFLVFKDMPPFVHYVLLLIMGIGLIR